jgi:hypothetical protein
LRVRVCQRRATTCVPGAVSDALLLVVPCGRLSEALAASQQALVGYLEDFAASLGARGAKRTDGAKYFPSRQMHQFRQAHARAERSSMRSPADRRLQLPPDLQRPGGNRSACSLWHPKKFRDTPASS